MNFTFSAAMLYYIFFFFVINISKFGNRKKRIVFECLILFSFKFYRSVIERILFSWTSFLFV